MGEGLAAFGCDMMGPVFTDRWEEGGPAGDVDVDILRVFVVAEEGLSVFPAVETGNLSELGLNYVVQGFTLSVAVDSTLNMGWLDLSTMKYNCASFINVGLLVLERYLRTESEILGLT